jgi:M6 family metalloprotease-like protein
MGLNDGPLPEEGKRPLLRITLFTAAILVAALLVLTLLDGTSPIAAQSSARAGGGYGTLTVRRSGEPLDADLKGQPEEVARRMGILSEPARTQLEGMRRARERHPFCDLISQGANLGVLRRSPSGWLPARGAPTPRDALLRVGPADELALGELARHPRFGASPDADAASFPAQDTVRILFLRIDFETDRSGSQSTGNGRFNLSPPDTINVPVDPTPHNRKFYLSHGEALRRYYEVTTHGRLVVEYDVYPQDEDAAYRTGDMADFGPWDISQDPDIFAKAYNMFRAFTVAADTQGVDIPWGEYDRVTFIHAGSDLQSDVNQDSPNDIPTFTIGVVDSMAIPVADSTYYLGAGMILPETTNQDGFFAALNAVTAHEMGHLIFGWRDVYNIFSGFPVCGLWTLMDTGNLVGSIVVTGTEPDIRQFYAIGILPPLSGPYQMNLVWDDVPRTDPVEWGVIDTLEPRQMSARTIKVPISSEEYLLLENRKFDINGDDQIVLERDRETGVILGPSSADSLEYDFLIPGEGIVVWQIDESVVGFDPPGRRSDDFFSLNGNPDRPGVQIIEADALDDLGDFSSPLALGSPYDAFYFPDNNGLLAPGGLPPLKTNSGTNPHLQIEVMDSIGTAIRVRVTRDWAVPGWPVVVDPPSGGLQPLVIDFASPIGRRVIFNGGDNAIHAFRPDGTPGGASGDILFQAPASLAPVAIIGDPDPGQLAVSVYPDPALINQQSWGTSGSWVIAIDGAGNIAPGYPKQITFEGTADWVTAGPLVVERSLGDQWTLMGTRSGKVIGFLDTGSGLPESSLPDVGNPILSLTATAVAGEIYFGVADSLGSLSYGIWGQPAIAASANFASPGWQPRIAWVEMNVGSDGSTQLNSSGVPGLPQLIALDRKTGRGGIYLATQDRLELIQELRGVDAPLTDGLAAGDLDGDGFNEMVLSTIDGRVGYWNLSGSATPGWPSKLESEYFVTNSVPVVADIDGKTGLEIIAITGNGNLYALDQNRRALPGWPLGTGAGQQASPALVDLTPDGNLELLIADADSLLHAYFLADADAGGSPWAVWGGNPGRSFALATSPVSGGLPQSDLVVQGSLKCYPNPATREPMVVTFSLREAADCRLTIFDPSGRQVAEISQAGIRSDNSIVWETSSHGPGLYVGRLQISSQAATETHTVHLGVLR